MIPQKLGNLQLGQRAFACAPRSRPCHRPQLHVRSSEEDQQATTVADVKGEALPSIQQNPSLPYKAIAALATLGTAETVYLTASKLLQADVACPTSGCESVLSSDYATLFGQPLSLYGMMAYVTVAALAVYADRQQAQQQEVAQPVNMALTAGVTLLSSCSAFLMYILQTRLGGESCTYCYTSAAISFSLLATLLVRMERRQLQDMAGPGLGVVAASMLLLYLNLGPANQSAADDFQLPYAPPTVTTSSSSKAVDLARKLKAAGAKMYGAFWCSHCFEQKQTFGAQAMSDFPYVECYPEGWQRGVQIAPACEAAGVQAFPTWVINGRVVEGELSLEQIDEELAAVGQQGVAAAQVAS